MTDFIHINHGPTPQNDVDKHRSQDVIIENIDYCGNQVKVKGSPNTAHVIFRIIDPILTYQHSAYGVCINSVGKN